MASSGRLPLQLPSGAQVCTYLRLHAHCGCPALRSRPHSVKFNVQAKALSRSDFFDREAEQSLLLDQLAQDPDSVLVVVGPRSSGKSRLLQEVLVEKKKRKGLVAFVDGRSQKLTDGGIMAQVLKDQGAKQLSELKQIIKTTGKVADAASTSGIVKFFKLWGAPVEPIVRLPGLLQQGFEGDAPCSLNDVIKAYNDLLKLNTETSSSRPLPVICIDEANVLMKWYKGGAAMEADLDALLSFLVQVSKQSRRAHVILATSEYSFITWITEKLGSTFFETQVIGDFPEAEARLYLEQTVGASIADAEWAEIFEVCGGNAGYLLRASRHFKRLKNCTKALEEIWRRPLNKVESGLNEGLPWSEKQYCTIVQLILEADYLAIIARDAYLKLKPGGEQAVQAMVKANLLAYRPASEWARDIPLEAFGPEQKDVVTAPSAAHLYCMRRLQRRGVLNPAAEAASITQTAAPKPSLLDQQIKDVEGKISMLETEEEKLLSTKPDDWQQERAYLREEKKQLREKEKQLREKELLLLRKPEL